MSLFERPNIGQVHTDCGNGGDDFTELKFVEDGGFASGVKADLYQMMSGGILKGKKSV